MLRRKERKKRKGETPRIRGREKIIASREDVASNNYKVLNEIYHQ